MPKLIFLTRDEAMRRQNLWVAMIATTATLGTAATHADFIDDSNVQLKFKNFYLDREYNQDTKLSLKSKHVFFSELV